MFEEAVGRHSVLGPLALLCVWLALLKLQAFPALLRYFSGLFIQPVTLSDQVTSCVDQEQACLRFAIRTMDFPNLRVLNYDTDPLCMQHQTHGLSTPAPGLGSRGDSVLLPVLCVIQSFVSDPRILCLSQHPRTVTGSH